MPLQNPRQRSEGGTFTQVGEEPLSKQVIGIRLPESIHTIVHNLPNRTEWLRRVITEAAMQELMEGDRVDE
ncbi:hypothetical protein C7B61_04995 [filamentous cyanobacterium CCP1]|nr:hypothetical protein C7B76_30040 [filamentous cyanobacterium CCP2]PSB67666.1 hypothetical protein C7B61_04995 [filamentous cyanobacterium CCP1]